VIFLNKLSFYYFVAHSHVMLMRYAHAHAHLVTVIMFPYNTTSSVPTARRAGSKWTKSMRSARFTDIVLPVNLC